MSTIPIEISTEQLLLTINAARLEPAQQARFDELVAKRQAETIAPAELQELIEVTDAIELRDAERLEALHKLARRRHTTVRALMDSLGIRSPADG